MILFGNRIVVDGTSEDEVILEKDGPLIHCSYYPYKMGKLRSRQARTCRGPLVRWVLLPRNCQSLAVSPGLDPSQTPSEGAWPCQGFFLVNFLFSYLFLAVLGLRRCSQAFSSFGEKWLLCQAVGWHPAAASSLTAEHRL